MTAPSFANQHRSAFNDSFYCFVLGGCYVVVCCINHAAQMDNNSYLQFKPLLIFLSNERAWKAVTAPPTYRDFSFVLKENSSGQSDMIYLQKEFLLIRRVWSVDRGLATAFNQCRLPWNVVLVSVTATVTPAVSTQYLQYPPTQCAAHSTSINVHSNHSLSPETLFSPLPQKRNEGVFIRFCFLSLGVSYSLFPCQTVIQKRTTHKLAAEITPDWENQGRKTADYQEYQCFTPTLSFFFLIYVRNTVLWNSQIQKKIQGNLKKTSKDEKI